MNKNSVLIVTIDPRYELKSVLEAFGLSMQKFMEYHKVQYWQKEFDLHEKSNSKFKVTITATIEQGNSRSAVITTDFINKFKPSLTILIGTAAGIEDKVKFNDIVFAMLVIDYDKVKKTPEGDLKRYDIKSPQVHLLNQVRLFNALENDRWLKLAYRKPTKQNADRFQIEDASKPKIIEAIVATGSTVFADGKRLSELRNDNDERIAAGETEANGFATASAYFNTPWLVLRGISDYGDPTSKNGVEKDRYHLSSTYVAACYARTFLKWYFSSRSGKSEINKKTAKDTVKIIAAYEKFKKFLGKEIQFSDIINKIVAGTKLKEHFIKKSLQPYVSTLGLSDNQLKHMYNAYFGGESKKALSMRRHSGIILDATVNYNLGLDGWHHFDFSLLMLQTKENQLFAIKSCVYKPNSLEIKINGAILNELKPEVDVERERIVNFEEKQYRVSWYKWNAVVPNAQANSICMKIKILFPLFCSNDLFIHIPYIQSINGTKLTYSISRDDMIIDTSKNPQFYVRRNGNFEQIELQKQEYNATQKSFVLERFVEDTDIEESRNIKDNDWSHYLRIHLKPKEGLDLKHIPLYDSSSTGKILEKWIPKFSM